MALEQELGALAAEVAREAGELAKTRRQQGVTLAATKSTLADIVTEADREVEALIRDRLLQARPAQAPLPGDRCTCIPMAITPVA